MLEDGPEKLYRSQKIGKKNCNYENKKQVVFQKMAQVNIFQKRSGSLSKPKPTSGPKIDGRKFKVNQIREVKLTDNKPNLKSCSK